jgi:hypothetical protein
MYASENAAAVAVLIAITKLTARLIVCSNPEICAPGSHDQAQSAGILAQFPVSRFNTACNIPKLISVLPQSSENGRH